MSQHADEAKGRLKEAAGDLTGDRDLEREGKVDRTAAKAKGKAEDVKDRVEDAIDDVKEKLERR